MFALYAIYPYFSRKLIPNFFTPLPPTFRRLGEDLYIHASNGSVILPGGYSANNHNNHQQHNNHQSSTNHNNTSTTNVPSSLSVQQLSTSQLSGGLLNNNGAIMGNNTNSSNNSSSTAANGCSTTVPHSQSAHEIGSQQQQVPLTPLAQHQQALHHQLQLRFAASNNANSGGNNNSGRQ